MNRFKVGDKVICINDAYSVRIPQCMFMEFPKKGREYTIRGFCEEGISMHLEEIRNEPVPKRGEIWFYNWRFRKTKNQKTKNENTKQKNKELAHS